MRTVPPPKVTPGRSGRVESLYGRASWLGGAIAAIAISPAVSAQTIRDQVRTHVQEELEREPEKRQERPSARKSDKKKKRPPQKKKRPRRRASQAPDDSWEEEEPEEKEAKPEGPKLPLRVIGKNLQLDPTLSGGYRGWYMQQYPKVDVAAQSYFTWSIDLKAKIFRLVNLHRGYYESNELAGPRTDEAVVAAQVGKYAPKAAWLLATIGVPINRAWEPIIKYETRSFKTSATPNAPVRIVPHETPANTPLNTIPQTTERLNLISGFETFVAGIRYSHSKDPSVTMDASTKASFPSIYLGVGLLSYSKPYQVTVGDAVLDEILFDARFRGAGLAFGLDTKVRPEAFFVDVEGQLGLGEIRLLEDLTLNELLPQKTDRGDLQAPEWLIGYLLGTATVGYVHPILRTQPTLLGSLALTGGGATFFAFQTQAEEGETVDAPPLNWDLLWGVRAALTLPL